MGRLFEAICKGEGMNYERYLAVTAYVEENFLIHQGQMMLEVGCDDGAYALAFSMMGLDVIRSNHLH